MFKLSMAAIAAAGAALVFNPSDLKAAPMPVAPLAASVSLPADLIQAQYRGQRRVYRSGRTYRGSRYYRGGRGYYRGPRVVYRGGRGYYRGHRGYRYYRPGYRRYGSYWFPPAAFAVGALLGGALASQAAPGYYGGYRGGLSAQHYAWCDQRYRSYRASDNTFQPYNGPRRQCNSPYS